MGEMCEECPIHLDRRLSKLKLIQDMVEQYRATYERQGVRSAVTAWLKVVKIIETEE